MPQRFERRHQSATEQDRAQVQNDERVQRRAVDATDDEALDAVLDDIASTLESNAEEYVSSFVQQGGE